MIWQENRENAYCEITPAIMALKEQWEEENYIDPQLYADYKVKRGLRDEDGRGVLTGLTRVAEIQSYTVTEDEHIRPAEGVLYYRGIDCREIVRGSEERGRYAFEEAAYLLLFGKLPDREQLDAFCGQLASYRTLPTNFFRDIIMKAPPQDLMNTMQRAILTLACYDDKPNDIGLENVLRQSLQLLSNMPVLAIYAYQAWRYTQGESLFIHVPRPELSTAENFLLMLREDLSYTALEARVLDVALVLHADHGGANAKVMSMMDDIKEHVDCWEDREAVASYLTKILDKDAFDGSGLIYGLGHAVYTKSDPRCEVFRYYVRRLAAEKDRGQELALYENVEREGKRLLMERRGRSAISTNIDFYSGLVYEMLGLPQELYTPLFAVARISGWSAHRMEELSGGGKLIRPRYECVEGKREYVPMPER